ncbi:A/G-specific adenine glycosylase [uncultured Rikenella sp.]|uniref:A/G-specific adenine glycosylase n=1 Tax=uncultured Rikenella sp. TaxID=368003 RepID=UPI002609B40B|nr:A/G-specific adenine glycosylase [uncultured Rikenella sp.]
MDFPALIRWYLDSHRPLPWRETRDPYRIWLSEVILQQTRVAQGRDYYDRFVARFPTVADLASAPEDEVLKLWQGLGYYSRARNLHSAAQQVAALHGGVFPTEYAAVRALKGIGDYTAAAVVSFSADVPYAVVDGNVYRVLSRLFDLAAPIDTAAGKREFASLAKGLLDDYLLVPGHRGAGLYNQAIMELGALVCTPKSPKCGECPVAGNCLARKYGTIGGRPVKQGRTKQTPRWFHYLHITDERGRTVICRREGRDIWQGLYEFPLIETGSETEFGALPLPSFLSIYTLVGSVRMPKHVLSHRIIHAVFHRIAVPDLSALALPAEWLVVPSERLGDYAVARLTELYLTTENKNLQ